jgi:hypothetical protein
MARVWLALMATGRRVSLLLNYGPVAGLIILPSRSLDKEEEEEEDTSLLTP